MVGDRYRVTRRNGRGEQRPIRLAAEASFSQLRPRPTWDTSIVGNGQLDEGIDQALGFTSTFLFQTSFVVSLEVDCLRGL